MAVTLEQIAGYLKELELKFTHDEEDERIVLFSGTEDSPYAHFIRTREDGGIFEWNMQILDENKDTLKIKDKKYAGKVLEHLLYLNYQTKFGTWEFDPSDGEVRLAVEIPLEDALMTVKQFTRIASLMMDISSDVDDIMKILNTGELPKDDNEAEMIAKLEAMLAMLKSDDSSGSSDDSDGI